MQRLIYPLGTVVLWTGNSPAIGQIKAISRTNAEQEISYSFHKEPSKSLRYSLLHESYLRPATPKEIEFFNTNNPLGDPIVLIEGQTMMTTPYGIFPTLDGKNMDYEL